MHIHDKRRKNLKRGGATGKAIVLGMLERDTNRVRATVIPDRKAATLREIVGGNVERGSQIMSDEHGNQWKMDEFTHQVVNHLETYVKGNVHTNGIENFWSLLKRGINGTYVSVEPFHLFRYVDEQAFPFNFWRGTDADRFAEVMSKIVGRRLTSSELTGKSEEETDTQRAKRLGRGRCVRLA